MDNKSFREPKKDLQFIVNDGIVYNKRDIMYLLWDLGFITYFEVEGEKVLNRGKGYIMRVSANSEDPTFFLNGRIYINVAAIDYLKVRKIKEFSTMYELYCDKRIIKIIPDNKKQVHPPFRYIADAMVGIDVMTEEEIPPEGPDDQPGGYRDMPPA